MADIRINSLPSTASASSSDDFLALDGATNGTRKLNAYSPTFGGNLIVGGTITSSGVVDFAVSANSTQVFTIQNTSTGASAATRLTIVGGTSSGSIQLYGSGHSTPNILQFSSPSSQKWLNNGAEVMSLSSGGNLTTSGNLTVSGTGTSTFGGKIQTTSANGIEAIVASGNTGLSLQSSTTQYSLYLNKADDSYRVYSSIGNTDRLMLTSGGNLLLGTTTDGGQKLQVAGTASITGNLTVGGNATLTLNGNTMLIDSRGNAATSTFSMRRDTSQGAEFNVLTALSLRWKWGVNSTTESGSNAGSNYFLNSYDDSGTLIGAAIGVTRSSMAVSLGGNLTVSGTQNVFGVPASANALGTNSTMTFELTSNTELKIKVRGTDGTTRSASLTLA